MISTFDFQKSLKIAVSYPKNERIEIMSIQAQDKIVSLYNITADAFATEKLNLGGMSFDPHEKDTLYLSTKDKASSIYKLKIYDYYAQLNSTINLSYSVENLCISK